MPHSVRGRPNQDHTPLKFPNVLLELEVAGHGYQYLKTPLRTVQKFAVLDPFPSQTRDGVDLVTNQFSGQAHRQVLVK